VLKDPEPRHHTPTLPSERRAREEEKEAAVA
jgi:hypothetical protein